MCVYGFREVRRNSSPVEVGAASHCVVAEVFLGFLIAEVFQGIRPQQVTHGPKSWWLLEPIQLHKAKTYPIKPKHDHTQQFTGAGGSYLFNVI